MASQTWLDALTSFRSVVELLEKSLDVKVAECQTATVEISQEQWVYVVVNIRKALVRFVLSFRECPDYEDCEPFAQMLNEHLMNFVTLYQYFTANAAPTLTKQLRDLSASLLTALKSLSDELIKENKKLARQMKKANKKIRVDSTVNTPVDKMFGIVEAACNKLEVTPLTNIQASTQQLQSVSRLIKDALNEMNETLKADDDEEDAENDDEDAIEDEIYDCFDTPLSADDKIVLPHCIILIKSAGGTIENLIKVLRQNKPDIVSMESDSEEEVRIGIWLEKIVEMSEEIQSKVDEMGSNIYPPQDKSVIYQNGVSLIDGVRKLLDFCQVDPPLDNIAASAARLSSVITNLSASALESLKQHSNADQ